MKTALLFFVAALAASSSFAQTPDYSKSVATVLVFTTTDCPISNRYAPEVKRLAQKFSARGVQFSLVYPVPADSTEIIQKHLREFAYDIPFTRDTKQTLVKFTGVSITPEAAVVDRSGKVVYRGRIDDRYVDFGKERPQPTTRDLENVLEALVAGKRVAFSETQAVGCYLPDLIK